jgi:hypothetical protein
MKVEHFILLMFIGGLSIFGLCVWSLNTQAQKCEAKGGVYVKRIMTYICVKGEVIE